MLTIGRVTTISIGHVAVSRTLRVRGFNTTRLALSPRPSFCNVNEPVTYAWILDMRLWGSKSQSSSCPFDFLPSSGSSSAVVTMVLHSCPVSERSALAMTWR
ncbi:unnamed protein product [Chondrus crispus]|uniref:Uncharacterized protein n=1 Tax=Chondrus crispus TaxID=2769 RepID=R7QKG0_CHOCR|nr:unnamed protein product [Chondrus crispus]CDF38982.1 unnamed protein product [Chondrus crispus]|eukprot:XP_005718887.1 unnamed protein product [Chondrus crispus]